ncbi:MAG: DUF3823 domain-containing protein [Ferruginibacter sp.]
MKNIFQFILAGLVIASFSACKKDNYTAPASTLTGKIVYNGEAIEVERNQVPFQIYQYGFGKVGAINSTFSQEGAYSAVLYDGNYKMIIPVGQGPFMSKELSPGVPDSIAITLAGSKAMDIEVMPYYMIRTPQLTGGGGKVNATFKIEKIINDVNAKDIESVTLFINKTEFVSGVDNIASANLNGADITDLNSVNLSVSVPAISPTQAYVFARIGLKIAGVEDRIFSPVEKITY